MSDEQAYQDRRIVEALGTRDDMPGRFAPVDSIWRPAGFDMINWSLIERNKGEGPLRLLLFETHSMRIFQLQDHAVFEIRIGSLGWLSSLPIPIKDLHGVMPAK